MKKKRDKKKEYKNRKRIYDKYGHLIGLESDSIPERHRASVGGLRCFRKVYQYKNKNKQTDLPKVRCGNVCAAGSLYCARHGGSNRNALVHGKRAEVLYNNAYSTDLGDVFNAFLTDPNILDHKRELATLRTILVGFVEKFKDNKPTKNPRKIVKLMKRVIESDHMSETEQYYAIKEIVENETSLLDVGAIMTINKIIDNIRKSIESIDKIERKSDFMLTPEGMKIILNGFSKLLNDKIKDPEILKEIYQGLLNVHVTTAGEVDVRKENAIESSKDA